MIVALEAVIGAAAALVLEALFPGRMRIGGEGPDLLFAVAVFVAARPGGSVAAAAALGALRDAASGGVPGRFAVGFLVAAYLLRAAFGRARGRGLLDTAAAAFAGALVAHAVAAVAAGVLGRAPLGDAPRVALSAAAATALFCAAVVVPLAAVETVSGTAGPKIDLSRAVRR